MDVIDSNIKPHSARCNERGPESDRSWEGVLKEVSSLGHGEMGRSWEGNSLSKGMEVGVQSRRLEPRRI